MNTFVLNKYFFIFIVIAGLQFLYDDFSLLFNKVINVASVANYIISVISGLFGFIIAAIPLTFQLLEPKRKLALMDEKSPMERLIANEPMKKKIFGEYIKILYACLIVFIAILLLEMLRDKITIKEIKDISFLTIIIPSTYITLFAYFFIRLFKLVKLLSGLIRLYFNSQSK